MNIIKHLQWRYATKKFDAIHRLPQEKIETLKQAFNLTATSYGLQPVKLVIVEGKNLKKQLLKPSNDQQQVMQASHVLVFCIEKNINTAYIEDYFDRVKRTRHTPDEILKPFKDFLINDFNTKPEQVIKEWATNQAYLAMGNLLTVCAVEKIDACPMEGFLPDGYNKILNLDEKGLEAVLVMPIGYRAPDDMFADFKKVRKNISESIIEL